MHRFDDDGIECPMYSCFFHFETLKGNEYAGLIYYNRGIGMGFTI